MWTLSVYFSFFLFINNHNLQFSKMSTINIGDVGQEFVESLFFNILKSYNTHLKDGGGD